MQAREALKQAAEKLASAGIRSAALDVRVLMEFATGKSREYFMAYPEAEINEAEFNKLIARRLLREPISHITRQKEFYGRNFMVNSYVLTPRPETELIIDLAKKYYKASEKVDILELGVGSGCIITTLALELPIGRKIGVDISNNALAIAKQNAYNWGVQGIEFFCSNWTKDIELKKFDLVVSNPPYIKASDKNILEAELGYEPEIALYAGNDGLDAYRQIAVGLKEINFRHVMLEIGQGQEAEIEQIFNESEFKLTESQADLAGITRILVFEPCGKN